MFAHSIVRLVGAVVVLFVSSNWLHAQDARLLRQPTLSDTQIAFAHAGDLWTVDRSGGDARRITSTPAVESDPHFSPDGKWIAFTSNRGGIAAVYVVASAGGTPSRLTWYPAESAARGWTPDGTSVLYASSRATAPVPFDRLWKVDRTGGPSELIPAPWGHDGSFSSSGRRMVVDRVKRWDTEWRNYRGGQNTPLSILNLDDLDERQLPNERTTDTQPIWLGQKIYFLSDRTRVMNIWSYDLESNEIAQLTEFRDIDVKSLAGRDNTLVFERDGYLHSHNIDSGQSERIRISLIGDFPWAETRWEDVTEQIRSSSLSATGKRALFESRGEIFTVPVEKGSTRNLTDSSGAADRSAVWSPTGNQVAWFSDSGDGYELLIADQGGLSKPRRIAIGESKMAWETTWSPDGSRIAFVDDDVRVRVVEIETGNLVTADTGGANVERGSMGLTWSPDSKWLAYAKTFPNSYHRIVVWSIENGEPKQLTDAMADAVAPAWSRDGKHLYLLASTNLALGSGWANTSQIDSDPEYGVYAIVLAGDEPTPLPLESDEETAEGDEKSNDENNSEGEQPSADEDGASESADKSTSSDDGEDADGDESDDEAADHEDSDEDQDKKQTGSKPVEVRIDFDGIQRRIISLPMPVARYRTVLAGPKGSLFVGERVSGNDNSLTLHKFTFKDRKPESFLTNVSRPSLSADAKKLLYRSADTWAVIDTDKPPKPDVEKLKVSLRMRLDRPREWQQMFDESWRYMRDFFYDSNMHGRDWNVVRERYAPLLAHVHHRSDLNYLIDQMSGEMSVGHSFVRGGDLPKAENEAPVGVLGADLVVGEGRWKLNRILTFENWNPSLRAPLDRPGVKVKENQYLVAIDGTELFAEDDPYRLLDGTAGQQTTLHINNDPTMEGAWTITVEPIENENSLRQRAWVEDNRRRVDELSNGKLAYVWVPNTGQPGMISFNRYFFTQQDKLGAVIDERFNGGGLLDDYMVDLMTRRLRAAITNEVPNGRPFRLPAGILGPKVLLINELAGSGGDFFPWVFRQQKAGPLIGTRTWGGLVKSSVHYPLVDGGIVTAPDNAVFDPINNRWIAENEGVAPDIEVRLDAKSISAGRDPQLERGVTEALRLLENETPVEVKPPPFPRPAAAP